MNGWMIGLNLLNLVVSVLVAVGLAWVATRTRKIEHLEAGLAAKAEQLVEAKIDQKLASNCSRRMTDLEGRLERKVEQQVDAALAAKTTDLMAAVRVLTNEIQGINRRLERGDGQFDNLGERGHQLELKLIERISATCATKEDVRALSQRFDALQQAVARALVEREAL